MSKMKSIENHTKHEPFIFITDKLTLTAQVLNIMVMIFFIKFNDVLGNSLERRSFTQSLTPDLNRTVLSETNKQKEDLQCLQERSNSKNMAYSEIINPIIMKNNQLNMSGSIDNVKFHPQTEFLGEDLSNNFTFSPLYKDKKFMSNNKIKLASSLKIKKEILVANQMILSKKITSKAQKYLNSKHDRMLHATNISLKSSLQNTYYQSQENKPENLAAIKSKPTACSSVTSSHERTVSAQLQTNENKMFYRNNMASFNKEINSLNISNLRRTQKNYKNSKFAQNELEKSPSTINDIIRKVREIKIIGNYYLLKDKSKKKLWLYNTNSSKTRNGSSKINNVMPIKMKAQFTRSLILSNFTKRALKSKYNTTNMVNKLHMLDSKSYSRNRQFNIGYDLPFNKTYIDFNKMVNKRIARKYVPLSAKKVKYNYYGKANKPAVVYTKKTVIPSFTNATKFIKHEFKNSKIIFSTQKPESLENKTSRSILNETSLFRKISRDLLKQKKHPINDDFMDDFNELHKAQQSNSQTNIKDFINAFSVQPPVRSTKRMFRKNEDFFLTMGRELINKYINQRKRTTRKANFRLREVEFPKNYHNFLKLDEDDDEFFRAGIFMDACYWADTRHNNYNYTIAYSARYIYVYHTWKSAYFNKVNNVVVVNFPTTGVKIMRSGTQPTVFIPIPPVPVLKQQCYMDHEIVFALFTLVATGLLFLSCCCYATVRVGKKRKETRKKYEYLTRISRLKAQE